MKPNNSKHMTTIVIKLQKIIDKYCDLTHNEHNYSIGGGLDSCRFASRRHEDAKCDAGKLTLGQAVQLFKKATGLDTDTVRGVIEYAVPNMEWHHAGKLPKSYGGGMKKTYFLNATEICDCAEKWNDYYEKLILSKIAAKNIADEKNNLQNKRLAFLQSNAKKVVRIAVKPEFFYQTGQEMHGKYGWFDSSYKTYKLPEYFSGWEFSNEQDYTIFLSIK